MENCISGVVLSRPGCLRLNVFSGVATMYEPPLTTTSTETMPLKTDGAGGVVSVIYQECSFTGTCGRIAGESRPTFSWIPATGEQNDARLFISLIL